MDMLASGSTSGRRVGPTAFVQFLLQMGRCIRFHVLILKEEEEEEMRKEREKR